jgi:predicted transcriptional regulator
MRTTIELSDRHRGILHALSSERGLRGYSRIIEEAIDFYIKEKALKDNTVQELLQLKGSWSTEEGERIKAKLKEVREDWRI